MRTVTLTQNEIEQAFERGQAEYRAWREKFPLIGSDWQFVATELVVLTRVWRQIERWHAENKRGFYYTVERVQAYGLPGIVMAPWNSHPREDYQTAHDPQVVYEGLRREVCGEFAYRLYTAACDLTGRLELRNNARLEPDYFQPYLDRYKLRIPDQW